MNEYTTNQPIGSTKSNEPIFGGNPVCPDCFPCLPCDKCAKHYKMKNTIKTIAELAEKTGILKENTRIAEAILEADFSPEIKQKLCVIITSNHPTRE